MQKTNFTLQKNLTIVALIAALSIGAIVFLYFKAESQAGACEYQKAIRNFPFKGSYYLELAAQYDLRGEAAKAASARRKARFLGAGGA